MAKGIDENRNYKQRFINGFNMLTGATINKKQLAKDVHNKGYVIINVWTMRRFFHGQDILGRERKQKENGKS